MSMNNYPPGLADYMASQDQHEAREEALEREIERLTDEHLANPGSIDNLLGYLDDSKACKAAWRKLMRLLWVDSKNHLHPGPYYTVMREFATAAAKTQAKANLLAGRDE